MAQDRSTLDIMEHPLDRIDIYDLRVPGIIGIKPDERLIKQDVLVNATLWVDTRPAAESDDIVDAVNYRSVTKAMIAHIESGKPMLVERLVAELAAICFEQSKQVAEVQVSVQKPGALRHARSVGITIRRRRSEMEES